MKKYDLQDVWRLENDSQSNFTYFSLRHQFFSKIDYILMDFASKDMVSSCKIEQMLWTDHTWIECQISLSDNNHKYRWWTFDKNILLTDHWHQLIAMEIEIYFKNNEDESVTQSLLWDAMRAVVRARLSRSWLQWKNKEERNNKALLTKSKIWTTT